MADTEMISSGAVLEDLNNDELLAEAVRKYPVLYDKTLKEFKDRNMKSNAWEKVAESLKSIGIISAEDARKKFQNLRAKYTRDKQKIKKVKKSGAGTEEVRGVIKETSDLYPFLSWLDIHVISWRRSKGNLASLGRTNANPEDSECGDSSANESEDRSEVDSCADASTSDEKISKATGHPKWEKSGKKGNKKDVDNVEIEMLKCMTKCLSQPSEKQKNEDELFGQFIASQLKNMTPEQNAMAKYQINQVCFQIKMSSMGMSGLGYSNSQSFPSSHSFTQPMTQNYVHDYTLLK